MQIYHYNIAGLIIRIIFKTTNEITNIGLLPSFEPFNFEDKHIKDEDITFTLTVDNNILPVPKANRQRIRTFDTGNGDTIVDRLDNGGYQYIVKNIQKSNCALLITNKDFTICECALAGGYENQSFGLNNSLMMAYAFAGSYHGCLLIHSSVIKLGNHAFGFIAKSGTGKSTQSSNWLKVIPGAELLNDDNPVVRVFPSGEVLIFGSPWSGKTPCYRNDKAILGGICRIDRANKNTIEQISGLEAFANFLPSCSSMKWEKIIYDNICDNVKKVVEATPMYILHCLPNEESAIVCHNEVTKNLQ